jgi:hypothetical protein
LIELLMKFLGLFFVKKTRFLSNFFLVQNLERGYTSCSTRIKNYRITSLEHLSSHDVLFLQFWGYLYEKSIFLKNLNLSRQSSAGYITWIKVFVARCNKYSEFRCKKILKKKKKSAQNFFILKYVIKNYKTSKFYY